MRDVHVFDALGRAVPLPTTSRNVNVTGLAPGMYVVRATRDDQVLSTRFQKL
jgi:hypothetical protein